MTPSASSDPRHAPEPPVTYRVGDHTLELVCTARWQWIVSIDRRELPTQYGSQADAWTAGVRAAYGLTEASSSRTLTERDAGRSTPSR